MNESPQEQRGPENEEGLEWSSSSSTKMSWGSLTGMFGLMRSRTSEDPSEEREPEDLPEVVEPKEPETERTCEASVDEKCSPCHRARLAARLPRGPPPPDKSTRQRFEVVEPSNASDCQVAFVVSYPHSPLWTVRISKGPGRLTAADLGDRPSCGDAHYPLVFHIDNQKDHRRRSEAATEARRDKPVHTRQEGLEVPGSSWGDAWDDALCQWHFLNAMPNWQWKMMDKILRGHVQSATSRVAQLNIKVW